MNRRIIAACVAWGLVSACGSDCLSGSAGCSPPDVPTPGSLAVRIVRPAAENADGAVILEVTGPGVRLSPETVQPSGMARFANQTQDLIHLIVVGANVQGVVARIDVPDVRNKASYRSAIREIAAAGTYAQKPASLYSAVVE